MAQKFVDPASPVAGGDNALRGTPATDAAPDESRAVVCRGKEQSHGNHIMRKMNFASFSELIRFAARANLANS
jgi:hypothetical protein